MTGNEVELKLTFIFEDFCFKSGFLFNVAGEFIYSLMTSGIGEDQKTYNESDGGQNQDPRSSRRHHFYI